MLDKSLHLLQMLRDFEKVERVLYRSETKRENDVEHSYQLAMMAWFFVDHLKLPLSKEKIMMYALTHDLVEVYAGDTPVYHVPGHPNTIETKKEREANALVEIQNNFSYFKGMVDALTRYEQRLDPESVFVYELDKIVPALNIYLDNGLSWNMLGVTLDDVMREKKKKVTSSKELVMLLNELLVRLDAEQGRLFEKK